jgi:hypothetical protein
MFDAKTDQPFVASLVSHVEAKLYHDGRILKRLQHIKSCHCRGGHVKELVISISMKFTAASELRLFGFKPV